MATFSYLYRLLLGLWLGAIVCFAAVVAPALFQALTPAQAGGVVRGIIPVLDRFALLAGPALLAISIGLEGLPRRRGAWLRGALLLAMTLCGGVSGGWVTPRLDSIRAQSGDRISALAAEDPLRQEFGRLHGGSTALMALELLAGLVALGLLPGVKRGSAQLA